MRRLPAILAILVLLPPGIWAADQQEKIAYTRKTGDRYVIHVMNGDGTADKELGGQTANVNLFPTWSPDGTRIACMSGDDPGRPPYRVSVLKADGTGGAILDGPNAINGRPCWSPDGKQIAFSSGGGEVPGIYIANADGTGSRLLTMSGVGAASPFWRRDGAAVGYSRLRANSTSWDLVFTKTTGGETDEILRGDGLTLAGANALSPDGKRLLYHAFGDESRKWTLHAVELESRVDTTVGEGFQTDLMGFPFMPAACWSADGKAVITSMPTATGWAIHRMAPDGAGQTRLTPPGADCLMPAGRRAP